MPILILPDAALIGASVRRGEGAAVLVNSDRIAATGAEAVSAAAATVRRRAQQRVVQRSCLGRLRTFTVAPRRGQRMHDGQPCLIRAHGGFSEPLLGTLFLGSFRRDVRWCLTCDRWCLTCD